MSTERERERGNHSGECLQREREDTTVESVQDREREDTPVGETREEEQTNTPNMIQIKFF